MDSTIRFRIRFLLLRLLLFCQRNLIGLYFQAFNTNGFLCRVTAGFQGLAPYPGAKKVSMNLHIVYEIDPTKKPEPMQIRAYFSDLIPWSFGI
jgi:hypothetical protein